MENLTLRDYLGMLRRRKWEFVASAIAFFLMAVAFAYLWPPKYRAEATIQVQQPDIPQGMVVPVGMENIAAQAFADQRIEQIRQKMNAESNLVDIITKFDLYPDDRRVKPMARVVIDMRKDIKIELLSADLANPMSVQRLEPAQLAAIAFTLSFDYRSPLVAQQVANELVTRFIDEDMKQRHDQARSTSAFLADEIASLEATMSEQERKISDFKAQHAGSMPDELPFNMQMAATTSHDSEDIARQLMIVDKQRGDLRTQLASVEPYSRVIAEGQLLTTPAIQLKALQAKYSTMAAQYGPEHPDVVKLRHQIDALQAELGPTQDPAQLQAQITDLRANLAAAEKTYGPDHPDVKALSKQLKALESQRAAATAAPGDQLIKKDADNPAYLMLMSQLQAADAQYQGLLTQQAQAKHDHDVYEQRVLDTAAIEREFAALSRDYDNAQLRYRDLKERKMSADMNETMEQGRKAERLVVIDAPDLPDRAHFPPRLIVISAGFVLSFFAGVGGAGLAESLSRGVHGVRHLTELSGAIPLVAIPHIYTRQEIRRNRLVRLEALAAIIAIAVGAGWLIDQYVMPLDVLWSIVGHRFGI